MKKKNLILTILIPILGFLTISCANKNVAQQGQEKIIIAHRGACGYLVEHTLESYALAYGLGADYIEADVNITKDNVPVVMHDIHLDTTTNVAQLYPQKKRKDGRYYIVDFTLAEIKKLSVYERSDLQTRKAVFAKRFPKGKAHFEVPTLQEEIELIQGLNKSTGRNVGIYAELKFPKFYAQNGKNIGKITLAMLQKYGYNKTDARCFIQCFDPTYLKKFKKECQPQCQIIQLLGEASWEECAGDDVEYMMSAAGLKEIAQYAAGIGPWLEQIVDQNGQQKASKIILNPQLVKDAHAAGLLVHPYTVRQDQLPKYAKTAEEVLHKFLFEIGVDGLFTDFTDLGVKVRNAGL